MTETRMTPAVVLLARVSSMSYAQETINWERTKATKDNDGTKSSGYLEDGLISDSEGQQEREEEVGGLREIVVTAQRRGQVLQGVPISIVAVTAADLETSGVDTTLKIQDLSPGLTIQIQRNALTPYLRGVGVQNSTPEKRAQCPSTWTASS